MDTQVSVEWEGELDDGEAKAIITTMRSIPKTSARLETESALGGMDLFVNKILIDMVIETVATTIVEAVSAVVKRLRESRASKDIQTVTLKAKWGQSHATLVLPLSDEKKLKQRLSALGQLMSLPE